MKPWEILSEEDVFTAKPFVRIVRQKIALPDGKIIDDFYQVMLRSYSIVVPITPDGKIIMIEQYKHGPRKVGLSFPSGFIEPGEAPEVGARRELLEETGYVPERMIRLGAYVDNGNQRGCEGHQFLAPGCKWVQPEDSGDLEQMHQRLLDPSEVDRAMADGVLCVTHDVAAWGMARVLHPQLFD